MKRSLTILCVFMLLCSACGAPEKAPTEPAISPTTVVTPPTPPAGFDARQMALSLSLEERVGQLFLARCPAEDAATDVATYQFGGYILFGQHFENETPESVKGIIASYQKASNIPMLIAVDEEGGLVCRVSRYSQYRTTPFPSSRSLYEQGGLELIYETEKEKCQLLQSLGINTNAAPVCDITTDPNAFMYARSLGQDPEITGTFVVNVYDVMQQNGIGGILKHFPGYGNNTDTHKEIAVDNRSLEDLESIDLVPFAMGIRGGIDAIMVSHTFINAIDPAYPASLSPLVNAYLRKEMGFEGVCVTDDLFMGAITNLYGEDEAAVLAVLAGNDLLCTRNYKVQYPAVLEAVRSGRIPEERINQAVTRILQWKYDMGLLEVK